MAHPSISVVIPCYNYARYVRRAVESVARQPGVAVEIIVIDDCSTDDSSEVLATLQREYNTVRVVHHDVNRGLIATINHGIDLIEGDVLLVLSADDSLAPGSLERALGVFDSHPGVGLVFGRRTDFADASELPPIDAYERPLGEESSKLHVHNGTDWIDARCRQGINLLASPEVFVRTSVQRAVGPYDAECRHTSDLNMWLRVGMAAGVAYVDGPPFAYYRKHGLNMSTVEFGDLATDLRERWIAYTHAIDTSGAPERRQARWRSLAGRALGNEALHEARRGLERQVGDDAVASMLEVSAEFGDRRALAALGGSHDRPNIPRDLGGRILHRLRWPYWLRRWERVGL